jgi:hypothetical protein
MFQDELGMDFVDPDTSLTITETANMIESEIKTGNKTAEEAILGKF